MGTFDKMRRLIAAAAWASASADEDDLICAQNLMDPSFAADVCSPFTGWILFMQLNGALVSTQCIKSGHSSEHDRRIFVVLQRDSKPSTTGGFRGPAR
jgi:hypothetical protein